MKRNVLITLALSSALVALGAHAVPAKKGPVDTEAAAKSPRDRAKEAAKKKARDRLGEKTGATKDGAEETTDPPLKKKPPPVLKPLPEPVAPRPAPTPDPSPELDEDETGTTNPGADPVADASRAERELSRHARKMERIAHLREVAARNGNARLQQVADRQEAKEARRHARKLAKGKGKAKGKTFRR